MAQQEMDYRESKHGTPETGYTGYQGISPNDDNTSSGMYGQKLSDHASFRTPTTSQRLSLALASLATLMLITVGSILTRGVNGGGAGLVVFVTVLFYAAVIVINVVFKRLSLALVSLVILTVMTLSSIQLWIGRGVGDAGLVFALVLVLFYAAVIVVNVVFKRLSLALVELATLTVMTLSSILLWMGGGVGDAGLVLVLVLSYAAVIVVNVVFKHR